MWREWSIPHDNMPIADYLALDTMTVAFGIRVENDQATVDAMINNGVDPEKAWDRTKNLQEWVKACLLTAYNIGRGKHAVEVVEVFAEYIDTMKIDDTASS
jgi:hypothetical protein